MALCPEPRCPRENPECGTFLPVLHQPQGSLPGSESCPGTQRTAQHHTPLQLRLKSFPGQKAAVRQTRLRVTATGEQPCSWKGPGCPCEQLHCTSSHHPGNFCIRFTPGHAEIFNSVLPGRRAPGGWRLAEIWRFKSMPELL